MILAKECPSEERNWPSIRTSARSSEVGPISLPASAILGQFRSVHDGEMEEGSDLEMGRGEPRFCEGGGGAGERRNQVGRPSWQKNRLLERRLRPRAMAGTQIESDLDDGWTSLKERSHSGSSAGKMKTQFADFRLNGAREERRAGGPGHCREGRTKWRAPRVGLSRTRAQEREARNYGRAEDGDECPSEVRWQSRAMTEWTSLDRTLVAARMASTRRGRRRGDEKQPEDENLGEDALREVTKDRS